MNIDLMAGFDAARTLPVGQGVQTAHVHGFLIRMISDHNDEDTFTLSVRALFAPPEDADRSVMTWRGISQSEAIAVITTAVTFSEKHFGELDLDGVDRELVSEIEEFLGN